MNTITRCKECHCITFKIIRTRFGLEFKCKQCGSDEKETVNKFDHYNERIGTYKVIHG